MSSELESRKFWGNDDQIAGVAELGCFGALFWIGANLESQNQAMGDVMFEDR